MLELLVAFLLIGLNGVFSLSELAVVSARKPRLTIMAERGRRGARAALALAEQPGRFLSTVQIGITLIGILAGAFSGAALGQRLAGLLDAAGLPDAWSETLGYGLVVVVITFLSVVLGELVPKSLALGDPERIACLVSPAMLRVAHAGAPIAWLLDASTRSIFRVFGYASEPSRGITDEEVRSVIAEAATSGVIDDEEHEMIAGVLRLGDRAVRALMTPRTAVEWLDLDDDESGLRQQLSRASHGRLPVRLGGEENLAGVVQVRDLLPALLRSEPLEPRRHLRQVPVIPDTVDALDALDTLRAAEIPMALVVDEYGHFEGLVTSADVLDAIAGAFRSDEGAEPEAIRRQDGSWLISRSMPADEMAARLGMTLPDRRGFETVAGLVLATLQHLPRTGEQVDVGDWRLEVVDLNGRRIDKLLASRPAASIRS